MYYLEYMRAFTSAAVELDRDGVLLPLTIFPVRDVDVRRPPDPEFWVPASGARSTFEVRAILELSFSKFVMNHVFHSAEIVSPLARTR